LYGHPYIIIITTTSACYQLDAFDVVHDSQRLLQQCELQASERVRAEEHEGEVLALVYYTFCIEFIDDKTTSPYRHDAVDVVHDIQRILQQCELQA
jgi:hypothetical protein